MKGFDDYDLCLGDIMRGERATKGKSLLDVQRELKIKATYIAAIENADPTVFESPGFVAGYVRSYARYLGLDPEWAYETFCEEGQFHYTPGGLTERPKGKRGKKGAPVQSNVRDPFRQPTVSFIPAGESRFSGVEAGAVGSVFVLLALVGAIGYGGWSVLQEVQKVQFTPVEQTPTVLSQLDPVAPVEEAVETAAGDTEIAEFQPPSAEAFDRLYRPQALDVPVLVSRDGPIANIEPGSLGALSSYRAPPHSDAVASVSPDDNLPFPEPAVTETASLNLPEAPQPTGGVQVVEDGPPEVALFAVRPSWVRVRSADGSIVFEKILDAGESFVLPSTEEGHTLRAGNAGSLYIKVGNETYGPAGQGASVVSNLALSSTAVPELFAVADPASDADLARFVAVAEAQSD